MSAFDVGCPSGMSFNARRPLSERNKAVAKGFLVLESILIDAVDQNSEHHKERLSLSCRDEAAKQIN